MGRYHLIALLTPIIMLKVADESSVCDLDTLVNPFWDNSNEKMYVFIGLLFLPLIT